MDQLATEYGDRVAFVAPAWKASLSDTARRAEQLLSSGLVQWGLDESISIFSAYAVGYQPVSILIGSDKTIVIPSPGPRGESAMRSAIEELLAVAG